MRYGFCTDVATKTRDRVEYELLHRIKDAGFDFVEFPLMMIETLSDKEFNKVVKTLNKIGLASDVCCNFFPSKVRLTGPEADDGIIVDYLNKAIPRAKMLGAKKIVFGSCPARNLPENVSEEDGYIQITRILKDFIVPSCKENNIIVVMEPIRKQSANFIVTLKDGIKVVNKVKSPQVELLADLMHMSYNGEDPADINKYIKNIKHVHICEQDRVLPEEKYSPFLDSCLTELISCGYDMTISFESKDGDLLKALNLLKSRINQNNYSEEK